MVDGQKHFCICREYFVSQVWLFLLKRRIYFFWRFVWLANCTAGTLWSIYDSTSLAPEGWFGVWIDWKKMFHLFISSLQIIRMTIRPRHKGRGVMSAITRISPPGQNRDKIRLEMRDTERTQTWFRQAKRSISLEQKNSLYQSRFICSSNIFNF